MIRAVLFDIGGTLHTVHRDADSADRFSALLLRRLAAAGICLETTPQALSGLLARNAEAYKHLSEETRKELPSPVIWGDYYLKDFPFDREAGAGCRRALLPLRLRPGAEHPAAAHEGNTGIAL